MSKRPRMNCGQCLLWLPLNLIFTIFLIFLSIKTSGGLTHFSWIKVFSPFWATSVLAVIFHLANDKLNSYYLVWGLLSNFSLTVFTILLPLKLDGHAMSWWSVMVPLWVFLLLINVMRRDERELRHGDIVDFEVYLKMAELNLPNGIVAIFIFSILSALHHSGTVSISWTLQFIPFFYYIFVVVMSTLSLLQMDKLDIFLVMPGLLAIFLVLLYLGGMNIIRAGAIVLIPIYILQIFVLFAGFLTFRW
eukprot:gene3456-3930_t